jgi:lantibiotic leader peptide-processing serine protease
MIRRMNRSTLNMVVLGTAVLAFQACGDPPGPTELVDGAAFTASVTSSESADRYIVVFATWHPDFSDRIAKMGGTVLGTLDGIGLAAVSGLSNPAADELRRTEGVTAVEPDLMLSADADVEPAATELAVMDDEGVSIESHTSPTAATFFARQWNLRAIAADAAWVAGHVGSPDVTAAILDTGIDYLHPDLAGRVDLSRSVSLLSDPVSNPSDEDALIQSRFPGRHLISDLHSHGTAISALIASNGELLAGVTQRTTLFGVKVHDRRRTNHISAYLKGIVYAADHGADVIHLSIPLEFDKRENPGLVAAVNRAINYAHQKGAVMVAAAGNTPPAQNIPGGPGDLDHDIDRFRFCNAVHVICVSATGPTSAVSINGPWANPDAVAPNSNFGRSAIDVAGPGGNPTGGPATRVWLVCSQTTVVTGMPSSVCTGGSTLVWSSTGTSFGAGATSGLAALLVSTMGKARPNGIEAAIKESADDLGEPGTDPYYGKGRINVARAMGVSP